MRHPAATSRFVQMVEAPGTLSVENYDISVTAYAKSNQKIYLRDLRVTNRMQQISSL
jgi:predicted AAA+ superfamily ATPase